MESNLELPPNFQEEMMNCELEFQANINETNIRKLIYVYTLGMQYYNLKEKEDFENYYRNKLNNLLLNDNVVTYLDTHEVDLSKKVDLNIFNNQNTEKTNDNEETKNEEQSQPTQKKSSMKSSLKNNVQYRDDTEIRRSPSLDLFKKKNKIKKADILEYVTRKIKEVDLKLQSIDKQVSNNIVEQMSAFESNKRNKKVKKSTNTTEKEEKSEDEILNEIVGKENTKVEPELDLNILKKKYEKKRKLHWSN